MLNQKTNVLITGVTGLIGGELIPRLVDCGVGQIYCLIRPTAGATAVERLKYRLEQGGGLGRSGSQVRLEAIPGDVTAANFGMSRDDAARVTRSVNLIIHCASELSFIRDASCRATNIAGMRHLMDLVRACRRDPLVVHVSTATICGMVTNRCVREADGNHPTDDHHNEYTRTKAVAEELLRESGLSALVVRPSVVLSADVPAENFAKAILWFLPLLNEFDAVPIDPESRVDVVPVSFVADAMVRLLQVPERSHDCYHVSAGPRKATRCGDVARFLDAYYERTRPLKLIPPAEWTRKRHREYVGTSHQRKLFSTLKYYLPFMNMNVSYDNTRLREALDDRLPHVEPMTDYLAGLLDLITPAMREEGGLLSIERLSA
jgi:thioester reductase-like protein